MSVQCLQCRGAGNAYLCRTCQTELRLQLQALPWWLRQLEVTACRQDRLPVVGRGSELPAAMNFDAADLHREAVATLSRWTFATLGYDDDKPAGGKASRLAAHTELIARRADAAECFTAIDKLTERIITTVNRIERCYFGPCTVVVAHDGRECGADLYGPRDALSLTCPWCKTTVLARKQLTTTLARRDLATEPALMTILSNLGEDISRRQLYDWIRGGRLPVRGYVHAGRIVAHKVRYHDPRVFSIAQARDLRRKDERLAKRL